MVDVELAQRVEQLEQRVAELERTIAAGVRAPRGSGGGSAAAAGGPAPGWTVPYEVAQLEVGETWIEMHEPSARRQLHRLITEVVTAEGPITEQLALRRVREAWGLKRAGARIQQVFDQAIRQLGVQETVRRSGDTLLVPGQELAAVRVPGADDSTRRSADEIPPAELELALLRSAGDAGGQIDADDLSMRVSKLFGWSRRGTEIQNTLDARIEALVARGSLERSGSSVAVVAGASES